jgi:hypothetical protein
MKITKESLKKIISEEIQECMADMGMLSGDMPFTGGGVVKLKLGDSDKESYDSDGRMARSNVYNLMKHASMLSKLVNDEDDLEPWVQEKIAVATEAIETVAEYLEYEKTRG